jgi:hypothetical protein
MGIVTHADGTDVQTPEYLSHQVSLMGQNAEQLLDTGGEKGLLNAEDWMNLNFVSHNGMENIPAFQSVRKNPMVSYLLEQWIRRYSSIFGVLARVEEQPLEQVEAEVAAFQYQINEKIGELRYFWSVHTGQSLPLQAALEQVRWNGPSVKPIIENFETGEVTHYLSVDALFPHVVHKDDFCDLMFDSNHISVTILRVEIHDKAVDAVKRELAIYPQ